MALLRKDVKEKESSNEAEYAAKAAMKRKNTVNIMKQQADNGDLEQTSQFIEPVKQAVELEFMVKKSGLVMGK